MNQGTPAQEERSGMGSLGCIVAFFIALAVIIGIFIAIANAGGGNVAIGRKATNSDVTINASENGLTAIKVVVVPKHDIKNLEITVSCYDKNKDLVKSIPVQFGDVAKSNQYQQDVSLSKFSFSELLTISYYRCSVTGGTVPPLG